MICNLNSPKFKNSTRVSHMEYNIPPSSEFTAYSSNTQTLAQFLKFPTVFHSPHQKSTRKLPHSQKHNTPISEISDFKVRPRKKDLINEYFNKIPIPAPAHCTLPQSRYKPRETRDIYIYMQTHLINNPRPERINDPTAKR